MLPRNATPGGSSLTASLATTRRLPAAPSSAGHGTATTVARSEVAADARMDTSARSAAAPLTAPSPALPDTSRASPAATCSTTSLLHESLALSNVPPTAASSLVSVFSNPLSRIVTPLVADEWERQLAVAGLLSSFSTIPSGLRNGFDIGLDRASTLARFSQSERYTLYDNHKSALRHPGVISANLDEERAEGRISDFYEPEEMWRLVGPFRNAPLTVAAKDNDFTKGRVCQDFSHPRDDPNDTSFNPQLDMGDFSCDWGTFSQCYLLAAPPQAT